MIGRDEIMDTHRPVLDPAIDKLLVQLATSGGILLLAVILATAIVSRDLTNLGRRAADRKLIFEPYHRASHRAETPGPTGLGLIVSRRLAMLMDGDVSYRHDGHDSVFVLSLPLVAARPSFAAAS